jgi:di/tricarboxylate transporter
MAGLFVLTSVFSQFISNTATAVLVAPIAMGAAASMGLSPYPFLMTVALAASTAFSTPMASPVNTLVLGPGGYRFNDFVKMGVPLQLVAIVLTLLTVPLLFPLQ